MGCRKEHPPCQVVSGSLAGSWNSPLPSSNRESLPLRYQWGQVGNLNFYLPLAVVSTPGTPLTLSEQYIRQSHINKFKEDPEYQIAKMYRLPYKNPLLLKTRGEKLKLNKKRQLINDNAEMAQMLELSDKDTKAVIINMLQ